MSSQFVYCFPLKLDAIAKHLQVTYQHCLKVPLYVHVANKLLVPKSALGFIETL